MENDEGRVMNDELEERKTEEFVYQKVDVGPMPVIDHEGGELKAEASVRSAPERAAFVARPAAEWVAEIVGRALPGRLLDDLWIEGELAVCFGESGSGKSVLAVQAADAIASGVPLVIDEGRFAIEVDQVKRCGKPATAEPRSVLYFDLKLTSLQFARRYTLEPDRDDTKFSEMNYKFPGNFIRCEFDPGLAVPEKYKTRGQWLFAEIESKIRSTGARIVVIDSLDRLADGILRTREAAYLMSRLNLLKHELGLSILVLANISRRSDNSPLTAGRLLITRTISAFADSVFAIGRCRWDERLRYLKHLASRSTDIIYDSEYLPAIGLSSDEGFFLSFWFDGFYSEETLLDPYLSQARLDRADEVKELLAEGFTQRDIAICRNMSLGSVNRALKISSPYDDRPKPPPRKPVPACPTKVAETVEHAKGDIRLEAGSPAVSESEPPVSAGGRSEAGNGTTNEHG